MLYHIITNYYITILITIVMLDIYILNLYKGIEYKTFSKKRR